MASPSLAAAVASRICHDVVGPLGAVTSGLELMLLTRVERTPEIDVIAESVEAATACVRFFRLAFGTQGGRMVGRTEITTLLRGIEKRPRLAFDRTPAGEQPRERVKAVFLLLQCMESAIPMGERIRIGLDDGTCTVEAEGPRLRIHQPAWDAVGPGRAPPPDTGILVQFALLPAILDHLGRSLDLSLARTHPRPALREPPLLPSVSPGGVLVMGGAESLRRIAQALDLAVRAHEGQRRKDGRRPPFVNHVADVARRVSESPELDETTLLAALLHDVVEKTSTTQAELEALFGSEVAGIVAELTDDEALSKHQLKRRQVEHAPALSDRAKRLKLADKASKLAGIAAARPGWWERAKARRELRWAREVAAGLTGADPLLEAAFDREAAELERVLGS